MPAYVVSYDLVSDRDYSKLYTALKSYPAWGRVVESAWVIISDNSAIEIRDHLAASMDSDDRLLVVRSGGEAAWRNVICDSNWLKDNI